MTKQRRGRSKVRSVRSPEKRSQRAPMRTIWVASASVLIVGAVVVVYLLWMRGSTGVHSGSAPAAVVPSIPPVALPAAYQFDTDPNEIALSIEEREQALRREQIEVVQHLVGDFPANANALFLLAMAYQEQGNSDAAAGALEQCLELAPARADAYDQLGRIAQQEGEHEKAVAHFEKARQYDPKMPGIGYRLGEAYKALGKPEEAIDALNKNAALFPKAPESFLVLGELYLQKQQYEAAQEHYEAALARDPNSSKAYYGLATAAARLRQREQATQYRLRFKELEEKEREWAQEKRITYDSLALTRASVAHTHTDVGRVLQAGGRDALAEPLWRRAAQLDPNNVACRFHLADCCLQAHRLDEALPLYEQILRCQPGNGVAYFFMGDICEKQGRKVEARRAYEKVVEVSPERPEGYLALSRFLWDNNGDLHRARKLVQRAVDLAPIPANYAFLSRLCHKGGDRAAAITAARRAVQLAPGNPEYRRLVQQVQEN